MDNQAFGNEWWDSFLDTTNNMSETAVFRDCITPGDTSLMRKYILRILADIARLRTIQFGYRVYIDGRLLSSNDMVDIYNSPPFDDEELEDWVKRTFGDKKFGMIINQGERFNPALSKMIALKLKPLLEKIGMPTEGIIFTLFIGNYDSTPLGIHLDSPGKSVIHFHLGPGSKTMYNWETQEYEGLVGEKKYNNKDIGSFLPYASKYDFGEGDIYFMPEDKYHVGTQEGLSIAIACWCYNRNNYDFALRLQALLAEQYLSASNENLKPDKNNLEDVSGVEKTLKLFNLPEELKHLTFEDLMRDIYKDLRYSLYSNAGYRTNPPPEKEPVNFGKEDVIQANHPFHIKYKEALDITKLHVYIRGTKIELNNFVCIKHFIDRINVGQPVKVRELLNLLDKEWDEKIGLYILSLMHKYHGITFQN
jgi:hypothetical protein